MPLPTTVDACPGVLTLHPARDGYVARVRLPGGYVSGRQWTALAGLAGDFGDGGLDLTARGNVQLRGLSATAGAGLARRAARAGLLPSGPHDRSRNITGSPLAGLGGRPPLRRLVRALDAAIVADPGLAALPGRFLFTVDDGSGGAGLAACDIGLRRAGRQVEMIIAGRAAGVALPAGAAVRAAVTAARAAVACGVGGRVTRIADLPDGGAFVAAAIGGSLGDRAAATDARLPLGPSGAAGSTVGGVWAGRPPEAGPVGEVWEGRPPDAGPVGEVWEGRRPDAGPVEEVWRGRPPEAVLVVAAPLGRLSRAQAALIGGLLRAGEVLRLGTAGRVVIPHALTPAAALASLASLAGSGLLTSDRDDLTGVTACSGMACLRAVADVRALARPLPGHPRTHWAACPRGCGRPPDAELLIAAGPDSFLVTGEPTARPLALLLAGAS